MRGFASCCLAAWLALGTLPAMAQQTGWGLAALMQSLARVRSASGKFSESRTLPMLSAPLLASGTLDYVAPDYIRKQTTAPVPQEFVLAKDWVTLTGGPGNQTHRFQVTQNPEIGGLAVGIRATLAGDLPALQQIYEVSLSGTPAAWQLVLKPRDARLAHFIAWIAMRGDANRIGSIDTAGGDGSHSEMRITEDRLDAR